MSDMYNGDIFTGLSEQIFKDVENTYNNVEIANVTKKYLESNASVAEKRYFVKLKTQYLQIQNIKDYKNIQEKLYDGKTRNDIISFEISRILQSERYNIKYADDIANIERLNGNKLSDELYEKIINLILRIEILLGIRIGLFNELCCLFEKEMSKIKVDDTLTYSRKK